MANTPSHRLNGRTLALIGAVLCGGAAAIAWFYGEAGAGLFGLGIFVRAAIVFLLVWLAYPSLQRPLRWAPPAVVVMLLVGLGILIARPKLLPIVLPALGIAATIFGTLGWLRKATSDEPRRK